MTCEGHVAGHPARCAESRSKRCECSCGGALHGIANLAPIAGAELPVDAKPAPAPWPRQVRRMVVRDMLVRAIIHVPADLPPSLISDRAKRAMEDAFAIAGIRVLGSVVECRGEAS